MPFQGMIARKATSQSLESGEGGFDQAEPNQGEGRRGGVREEFSEEIKPVGALDVVH